MSTATKQFVTTALSLSADERAEIVTELLASLEGAVPPQDQAEVDAAWSTVIARRIEEVEGGKVELLDGDEIHRQLRAGTRR